MSVSLRRLRAMTADEIAWRTRQAGRTAAQRMASMARPPRWNRHDLYGVLADGVLDSAKSYDPADRWHTAQQELRRHIEARKTRFVLDPRGAGEMRAAICARWPSAGAAAAARADRILSGEYDLLGYRRLACTGEHGVDWHRDPVHARRAPLAFWADVPYLDSAVGDHKIIWELNRQQHWLQLGRALWLTQDGRYRRAILEEFASWLAANPPLRGINWASMLEVGLRSISWVWGLHFLLGGTNESEGPWLADMLVALDKQLTHVEHNLSTYFSPNTHLTGEALALYVVGVALPELAASRRWTKTGRSILLAEIDRQILADGGHAERSTHYQRYTLDFYLMALLTAERDGDVEAVTRFTEAVTRLAEFTRTIADDRGCLPLIGDDDGGMLWPMTGRDCNDVRDSLGLAAMVLDRADLAPWGVQEEALWVGGQRAIGPAKAGHYKGKIDGALRSRTLPETGFVVVRDGSGSHAVFDVGPHGYLNGGHAHADALSVTLALGGRPLLIDPGTSTYTVDPMLRDRLRSSMSHNTITLGNRSQAVPSGPFQWQSRADARLHDSRHNGRFDWAEAFHDGYAPLRHRRTLLRTADSGWLIADTILGSGNIDAGTHWHFDPAWTLKCDAPGRLKATHLKGDEAWLLHDAGDVWLAHGDEESGLGWHAPVYGTLIPTWSARIARRAAAPFTLLTWVNAAQHGSAAPTLERLAATGEDAPDAIRARVVDGDRESVFLLRPGEPSSVEHRGTTVLDYQTNARMLHYVRAGRFLACDVVDATHALALREGGVSIAASEPVPDLHLALRDGILDLHASAPPPQLRLQGSALCGLLRIRLNGREMLPPQVDRPGALTIAGADWPAPPGSTGNYGFQPIRGAAFAPLQAEREEMTSFAI